MFLVDTFLYNLSLLLIKIVVEKDVFNFSYLFTDFYTFKIQRCTFHLRFTRLSRSVYACLCCVCFTSLFSVNRIVLIKPSI